MSVVFPDPVAPTIATCSPAATRNDTSRSTQSSFRYANHTCSNTMSPRARAGACGSAGAGSTSRSRTEKMRSAAVIDDCMTAYLALKSRIGTKNCWMYWMNATSVPISRRPFRVSRPPSHSSIAIETVLIDSTKENSAASSLLDRW